MAATKLHCCFELLNGRVARRLRGWDSRLQLRLGETDSGEVDLRVNHAKLLRSDTPDSFSHVDLRVAAIVCSDRDHRTPLRKLLLTQELSSLGTNEFGFEDADTTTVGTGAAHRSFARGHGSAWGIMKVSFRWRDQTDQTLVGDPCESD